MRKLVMGCAVAGLIALSPPSEAGPPILLGTLPLVRPVPKAEIGLASWYGIERQGMPTASGQLFDKDRLTAAHRKLPLGTKVRVTNLKNLESTELMINDRGPGISGRVIDLSFAAAKQLGFLEAGLARVEIDVISYSKSCDWRLTSAKSTRVN
jgi:rare lipoprotein A